jgi:hemerythrin
MAVFAWSEDYRVGDPVIDQDHCHLIGLLNDLNNAMSSGKPQQQLGQILDDLIVYAIAHFKREEVLMEQVGYAEYAEHKHAHERLTSEVLELQRKFVSGETRLTLELMMFLSSWLFEHILEADKRLERCVGKAPRQ